MLIAVGLFLAAAARAWLCEILMYPHDAWRADMLIVIQEGIRRVLTIGNISDLRLQSGPARKHWR